MTLRRTSGIAPMSDRRRAELAAEGNPYPSSTLAVRKAPERKPTARNRPTSTGPDQATVNAVLHRDGFQCVRCGGALHGTRSVDWSIQHRRARGRGGTNRPDANAPQNLIALCGSAAGCNGWVESERIAAREGGWAIRQSEDPALMPVAHSLHGFVWLTPECGWTSRRPANDAEAAN